MNYSDLLTGMAASVVSASAGVAACTVTIKRRTMGAADVSTGKRAFSDVSTDSAIPAVKSRRSVSISTGPGGAGIVAAVLYTVKAASLTGSLDTNSLIKEGSGDYLTVLKIETRAGGAVVDVYVRDLAGAV